MKKNLTDESQKLIEMLLMEPKIAEAVFVDIDKRETYRILDINQDGTLTLGKRSVRWWNRLFNLEKTISFKDFAFNVLRALVGMATNMDKNDILQGLSEEIISKAVLDQKFDFVVNRLFDVARFAVKSGKLNTVVTPENGGVKPERHNGNSNMNVNVSVSNRGLIPVYDSVGNVLLHLRVKVDGYTLDRC